ncbi:MAG: hypothetical protein MK085_04985 [Phycisphaerales bacterium]|nr:hypothetical protein [Phycisphaerales bacterium]
MTRTVLCMLWMALLLAGAGASSQSVEERWHDRLHALTPADPMAYFVLAEEILDSAPGDPATRRLASWLFGTAGRLDPKGLSASSALAIADLMGNVNEAQRMRAVARMLDPRQAGGLVNMQAGYVDAETAFELAEGFARMRSGRSGQLRTLLADAAIMDALRPYDQSLPGGLAWLESVSRRRSGRPDLSQDELVQMLRMEVRLLEGDAPSWSSEVLGIHGRPLLEVQRDDIETLLGGDPDRPYWRNGKWQSSSNR